MTIIQKHGKGEPRNLADYQFGWSEGDGKNYLGELYIKDGDNGIHPVTAQVKNEIMGEVHNIRDYILSKIKNGKIKAVKNYAELVDFIDYDKGLPADERRIEANWQFIVKTDDRPSGDGHNDTVLWIVVDKDGEQYDPNNSIDVSDNLIALPITALDLTYHDPKSLDGINFSDCDNEDDYVEKLKDAPFGIAVGVPNETGNTIAISLTPKTTDFLNELENLGLVGNGSNDIFREGFVNGLSVEANPIASIEKDGKQVNSGVKISFNKKIKADNGQWTDQPTNLILNLDGLVIDEGSW